MAKKRKKTAPQRPESIRKQVFTQTFINNAQAAVRKTLQAYGLDPALFDRFSKNQRNILLCVKTEQPRFCVAKGHRVPRQLINMVNQSTQQFLRNNFYGDPGIGLTYLELATFGATLFYQINIVKEFKLFTPDAMAPVDMIFEKFNEKPVGQALKDAGTHIVKCMQMISKVNFRVYGYRWTLFSEASEGFLNSTVTLSSEEGEAVYFRYRDKYHKAFRVKSGQIMSTPPCGATIDERFIRHNGNVKKILDIYIQSHALLRIKERIDIFPASWRNYYAMFPLLYMHRVVFAKESRSHMFECYFDDVLFGYYPFVVQKNRLFVLSFLPILSPDTPKGAIIVKKFKLRKQDLAFLGMDKLSFFFTVDFSQIPVLRDALLDVGLAPLLNFNSPDRLPFEYDIQKTLAVKKFFQTQV